MLKNTGELLLCFFLPMKNSPAVNAPESGQMPSPKGIRLHM
ncbi:hypothetical protein B14911_24721 [Bacillus sp. NRRL B-14911]|uniref:Uncharacterized protein n=1 Tax=Bacillus infantis NRRL B-14911 TaxID=1367477 RepID=U5LH54_9BACI|nr:hypothetical protein N288_20825 [Bacillus infantis NRRL B-14911]EAR64167.1 hypothetical protein B14911_24721 [Bacillus sp. NRRL B-14911]